MTGQSAPAVWQSEKRHGRKSVPAVTPRSPATMPPMRRAGTPMHLAGRYCVIPPLLKTGW